MKRLILLFVLFVTIGCAQPTVKMNFAKNGKLNYQFAVENHLINGDFLYFYSNGKIMTHGIIKNNLKVGEWKMFDTNGVIIKKVVFEEPKCIYDSVNMEKPDISAQEFRIKNIHERNINSLLVLPQLSEKNIVWSLRLWRSIENNSTNSFLFDNQRLFSVIQKEIESKNLQAFQGEDLKIHDNDIFDNLKNKNFDVIAYKILEDWFYNKASEKTESRILAICPVTKEKTSGRIYDLCWLYYPELRKSLGAQKLAIDSVSYVQNIDDALYFRYFDGEIYKVQNVKNQNISEYKQGKEIKKEIEATEVLLMKMDAEIWTRQIK